MFKSGSKWSTKWLPWCFVLVFFLGGLHPQASGDNQLRPAPEQVSVTVDISKTYQVIDNFAASDAWSGQFVGNWPEAKKNAIADLLFSTKMSASGQPEGIGLSLWRFNIGAGSAQQGDQSRISDEWRRAESFLQEDRSYDWERQAGQRWFLRAAKERGVNKFLAFPNSPPVQLTKNGKAFGTGGKSNLAPEKYDDFATYLVRVLKGVQQKEGILFNYISPVNEPQWDWSDGGQEGSAFWNTEVAGIVRALNTALGKEDISTSIDIAEAGKIDYLFTNDDKPGRGNQVEAFFNANSPAYVGNLSHVGKVISAHSYFTTSPHEQAIAKRKQVAEKVASVPGLKFWQSEYCILGDNAGEINGKKRDLGIDPALYMARVIHNDLVVANATAWQWWLAISPYDYKDGLVYIDHNKTDGKYYESKMLWALGNYSRFIRPGAVRVETKADGRDLDNKLLLASSYVDAANKQLITVVVNAGSNPVTMKMEVKGGAVREIQPYITSENKNLAPGSILKRAREVKLEPKSVTTLVSRLK